jgi:hypothetical protein
MTTSTRASLKEETIDLVINTGQFKSEPARQSPAFYDHYLNGNK